MPHPKKDGTPGRNPRKGPIRRRSTGQGVVVVAPRTADLIDDPSMVKEWDDEELQRGQRRDKNGGWTGRPPTVVPTFVHREIVRRQLEQAAKLMSESTVSAVTALVEIIESPIAEDRDRIAAAKIILDRVMGKAPETVKHTSDEPAWIKALKGGIVAVQPIDEDDIIDVEPREKAS